MSLLKDFKFLIKSTIIGVFFIILSTCTLISLITYSAGDIGFGKSISNGSVNNLLGFWGAYYSSFLMVFFNFSSYLFVIFFGLWGFRITIKKSSTNLLTKLFILIVGIAFVNFSIELIGINFSLLGKILLSVTNDFIQNNFKYLYINEFLAFMFGIVAFLLIYMSLNMKLKFLYLLFFNIYKLFIKTIILFATTFKLVSLKKNKIIKKGNNKKYFTKKEPTINKTIKNNLFKSNENETFSNYNTNVRYELPPLELLKKSNEKKQSFKEVEKRNLELSKKLEETLKEYGVEGKISNFRSGPVVTLFEFIPAAGIKTSKITSLADDIARAMSSISTRIALQPGKTSLGIEIPNKNREGVLLGDLISGDDFLKNKHGLNLALGKNISGEKIFANLEKMPHLLIAGTTGSGKSVGINSMIISLLYNFTPSECKLILIDPKMLELSVYADIPHLLTPVVTNPQKAVFALKWVVREMENRYKLMSSLNVKKIESYNDKIIQTKSNGRKLYRAVQTGVDKDTRIPIIEKKEILLEKMPLIVVVIDEMADLMMVAGKEVENLIQRLAQMARASGIHIIAATQRPSVDVITGTIKANFPSRISFRVASRFDSRTILNEMGAEQLLGSGDMLFLENGSNIHRLHGGFISEAEIESIVKHIKSQRTNEVQEDITVEIISDSNQKTDLGFEDKNVDELYDKAIDIVIKQQKVSTSFIQRYLQIGYNRAARIVEKMEDDGYITEANHAGKRSVVKKNK